jgi:hypothetical protein
MATRARRADRRVELGDWRTHYELIWKPMATPHTQPVEHMTLPAFQAARQALRDALRTFEVVVPNCRSCEHFENGGCKQFGDVPADFQQQAEACESWSFDAIPFDGGHRP